MIKYNLTTFDSGINFIEAPITSSEAVSCLILVKAGGRYETSEQSGISHFLEHLFFKGSQKRPSAFEISKELDSIGASFNAFTSEEYTGYYVQCQALDFPLAFDVLTDMFLNPLFPEAEVEREKGVIIEESNMYHDMPQAYVQILNQEQMFKNHPLGKSLLGEKEVIKKATRNDIYSYHAKNYAPQNLIVAISGKKDVDWKKAVEGKFGKLERAEENGFIPFQKKNVEQRLVQDVRKVDQTHFVFSFHSFDKKDERNYAQSLLNTILGSGMSSRLFMDIRERRGLAYYVRTSVSSYHDTGTFSISAGVKTENLKESVELILKNIKALADEGPSEEELERAKGNLRGSLALALEDSIEIASFLADDLLYLGEIRDPDDIIAKTNAITKEQVQSVAKEIFKIQNSGISIVGPKDYSEELKSVLDI